MLNDTTPSATRAWLMVAMLFVFMLINFADKAVLGLAALPIMHELGLNHGQFGLIGASFFAFFSLSAVIVGFMVNRLRTKWVLAAMALIWSLCQLPMALSLGIAGLLASRAVLGAGEGPAYPVALHAIFKWFPDNRRAVPAGLIAIGGSVGAGLVSPMVVYVIVTWSWRAAFGLLGVAGLVWLAFWIAFGREGSLGVVDPTAPAGALTRIPYRQLLGCRTVVGVLLIAFCAYWLLALAIVWLPAYLVEGRGYRPTAAGWIITLPFLLQIAVVPGICSLSDLLKRRGGSSKLVRGHLAAACAIIAGLLAIALPIVQTPILSIACVAVAFSIGGAIFVLGQVLVAEVTPVMQRGAMLGSITAIATLAGPLAPALMGWVVNFSTDPGRGFRSGFIIAGGLVAAGSLLGMLLIDPERDRARFATRRPFVLMGA